MWCNTLSANDLACSATTCRQPRKLRHCGEYATLVTGVHTLNAMFNRRSKLLSTDLLPTDRASPSKNGRPVLHVLAPAREGGLERVVQMVAAGQRFDGVHVACVLSPAEAPNHPFVRRLTELGVPTTRVLSLIH